MKRAPQSALQSGKGKAPKYGSSEPQEQTHDSQTASEEPHSKLLTVEHFASKPSPVMVAPESIHTLEKVCKQKFRLDLVQFLSKIENKDIRDRRKGLIALEDPDDIAAYNAGMELFHSCLNKRQLGDPAKIARMFNVDAKTKKKVETARDKILKDSIQGTVNAIQRWKFIITVQGKSDEWLSSRFQGLTVELKSERFSLLAYRQELQKAHLTTTSDYTVALSAMNESQREVWLEGIRKRVSPAVRNLVNEKLLFDLYEARRNVKMEEEHVKKEDEEEHSCGSSIVYETSDEEDHKTESDKYLEYLKRMERDYGVQI